MEDSTGMTIEFLRARLLSERSVSRTARQRADELAKRVVELEQQLKIVSLQRKKAEKATENVLSILENHGINEFSEEFDSSSDQEVTYLESKLSNGFPKEEESSVGSKTRRNHMDEFSGSELESSLPGRSLSWKSCKDSPHSHEKKHVNSSTRSRTTFASTTSASLKRRVGKSCRRIRGETRSAGEESQIDGSNRPRQENGVDTCSEGSPASSDIGPEILRETSEKKDPKIVPDGPVSGDFENERSVSNTNKNIDIHGSEKDMERALEHQAQLIGQYEEEEKAQREWEEKYKEDNSCAPDSCEPGNCSDVMDEQIETKGHTPYPDATLSQDEDTSLSRENACFAKESPEGQSDEFQLPSHMKQIPQNSCSECPAENQSPQIVPSHPDNSLQKGEIYGNKNEYALVTRETPDKLGSVLEALHQAKLSLKDKLIVSPLIDRRSSGKALEYSVGDRPVVPVGCARLFRVPDDFHIEATSKASIFHSNSRLSLPNYSPDSGRALTSGNNHRFITSPYTESRSSASTIDNLHTIPTNTHMERGLNFPPWEPPESTLSRFSSRQPVFGRSFDTGLPFSTRSTYEDPKRDTGLASSTGYASQTYTSYPDLIPWMPYDEGLRPFSNGIQPISNGRGRVHPPNHFSHYDDSTRPNMYRL